MKSPAKMLTLCIGVFAALFLLQSALPASAASPVFSELPAMKAALTNPPGAPAPAGSAKATNSFPAITNSMDALDADHSLAIGDRLSFRIVEDEEDPKPLIVTDSGELECPYIGRYPAVNMSCKQLARQLKIELEKEYYYQATVIIAVDAMTKSRGKVYLVGPIRVPGPQDIPSDETFTLSKAILRAGGFSDEADKRNVQVTRKGTSRGAE